MENKMKNLKTLGTMLLLLFSVSAFAQNSVDKLMKELNVTYGEYTLNKIHRIRAESKSNFIPAFRIENYADGKTELIYDAELIYSIPIKKIYLDYKGYNEKGKGYEVAFRCSPKDSDVGCIENNAAYAYGEYFGGGSDSSPSNSISFDFTSKKGASLFIEAVNKLIKAL